MWNFFLRLFGKTPSKPKPTPPPEDINWGLSLGDPLSNLLAERAHQEHQKRQLEESSTSIPKASPEVKRFQETQAAVDRARQLTMENIQRKSTLTGERLPSGTNQNTLREVLCRTAEQEAVTRAGLAAVQRDNTRREEERRRRNNEDWTERQRQQTASQTTYNSNFEIHVPTNPTRRCDPAPDYSTNNNSNWQCPSPTYDNSSNYSNYDSPSPSSNWD
jgi:hypothetical protein